MICLVFVGCGLRCPCANQLALSVHALGHGWRNNGQPLRHVLPHQRHCPRHINLQPRQTNTISAAIKSSAAAPQPVLPQESAHQRCTDACDLHLRCLLQWRLLHNLITVNACLLAPGDFSFWHCCGLHDIEISQHISPAPTAVQNLWLLTFLGRCKLCQPISNQH